MKNIQTLITNLNGTDAAHLQAPAGAAASVMERAGGVAAEGASLANRLCHDIRGICPVLPIELGQRVEGFTNRASALSNSLTEPAPVATTVAPSIKPQSPACS